MSSELLYDVAFSYEESLTPFEKVCLFERYESSRKILEINKGTLKNILGRRWTGKNYNPDDFLSRAEKIIPELKRMGIKTSGFYENDYPVGLKHIPDYPYMIYYRGNIDYSFEDSIAVVGTRNPDDIGKKRAELFCSFISLNQKPIISGLALGVDSIAHRECVMNKNKTLAVFGCGIERIYPHENTELAKGIMHNNGALISEYPPGIIPKRWNFPKRNRIIVGLSKKVLIIQAPSRSGSLISAMLAADYNRELYVVSPDNRCGVLDEGNRELIMNGAKEINHPEEIISKVYV